MEFPQNDLQHDGVPASWHASEKNLSLDGNFARIKVFEALDELGITGITRLRSDANMRYIYEGPRRQSGSGK